MRRTENILKRVFAFLDRVKTRLSGWKKKKEKKCKHVPRSTRVPRAMTRAAYLLFWFSNGVQPSARLVFKIHVKSGPKGRGKHGHTRPKRRTLIPSQKQATFRVSGVRENVEIRNSKTKRVNETNPFFSETFHENEKKNNRFQSNELKIKLILRPV